MTRVDRHRAGRAEIDISQTEDQIAGVGDDPQNLVAVAQAVGAGNKIHVVRQPRRRWPHRLPVAFHGGKCCTVFKCHWQMDDARRDFQRRDIPQRRLQLQQLRHQLRLGDALPVIAHLQRAYAGRKLFHARNRGVANRRHQQMHPQPQRQIQHVFAVFNQNVAVASLPPDHRRARPFGVPLGEDRGAAGDARRNRSRDVGQRVGGTEVSHRHLMGQFKGLGPGEAHRMKADFIAGFHLADFPQLGFGNGDRADKSPQARSVTGQDHREVTGEVNRADGVLTVVNVRRMQTRFPAVGPRPLRLRPDQTHPKPVGVVVHLPLAGEKRLHGFRRKEVGRAVRSIQHADVPRIAVGRYQRRFRHLRQRYRRGRGTARQFRSRDRQDIGHFQGSTGVAAELTEGKGRAAAKIQRHINAVTYRQICATA